MKQFDYIMDDLLKTKYPLFDAIDRILTAYNNSKEDLSIDKYAEYKEIFTTYFALLDLYESDFYTYTYQDHTMIIKMIYTLKGVAATKTSEEETQEVIRDVLNRYGEFFGITFDLTFSSGLVKSIDVSIDFEDKMNITSPSQFQVLIRQFIYEMIFSVGLDITFENIYITYVHEYKSEYYISKELWNCVSAEMLKEGTLEKFPLLWEDK